MKTSIKNSLAAITLTLLWSGGMAGEAGSHRQAVEKLFELTRMQEKIDASVNNVVALQLNPDPAMRDQESTHS